MEYAEDAFSVDLPIKLMEAGVFKSDLLDSKPLTTTASNAVVSTFSCEMMLRDKRIEKRNNILFKGIIYFWMYITSLINFTVLATSGKYAATKLGA
jgi:hypothetical protein